MISGKLDSPRDFGRYTLVAKVASGGMATVFRGHVREADGSSRELTQGREVAVKILHDHLAETADFVRMFKDEGRIVRDLDHVNVVHVFDVGECEGMHYLAMEFVDGRDLAQVLLAHRLNHILVPAPVAFEIMRQSLVALRYVHDFKGRNGRSLGLVHRDISPHNLLISRDPLVKLTDFGIARGAHRSDRTRTGTIKGKMHYMAPEQASGERVDGRADLYAMGAVAYELLTGQELFGAENTEVLHARAARGDIQFGSKFERLPDDVKIWLRRSLAVNPDSRFQSADAMLAAMEQIQKAARTHYKPETLVKLLDMEDARRSKQREKAQKLILDDAAASGRLSPGMVMRADAPPPKIVPTGARVELDAGARVSRLNHDRRESKVDWDVKPDLALRPATVVRELENSEGHKRQRTGVRQDLLPAEAAHGKSYKPSDSAKNRPENPALAKNVEALTPGSLLRPQLAAEADSVSAASSRSAAEAPGAQASGSARKPRPTAKPSDDASDRPGLALSGAVAWSCAALLLFAVTQELLGAELKLPEAADLRVASLWEEDAPASRTDAIERSAPHGSQPLVEIAQSRLVDRPSLAARRMDLGTPGPVDTPDASTRAVADVPPVVPVRKLAGGMMPILPKPVVAPERAERAAAQAVARNAEVEAWQGRPVEHVAKPGEPEKGAKATEPTKPTKPVTFAEARAALESAGRVVSVVAGYQVQAPKKAQPVKVPADNAKIVPAAKPAIAAKPVTTTKPTTTAKADAKPIVPVAKTPVSPKGVAAPKTVAVAKPAVAKPALAKSAASNPTPAKPVAAKPQVATKSLAAAKPSIAAKPPSAAPQRALPAKPAVAAKPALAAAKSSTKPAVTPTAKPAVTPSAKPVVPTARPLKTPSVSKPVQPIKPVQGAKPTPAAKPAVASKPVVTKPAALMPTVKKPAILSGSSAK